MKSEGLGIAGKLARGWISSKLTPLFIAASLALGAFSIMKLPREEEPQIIVPMIDIFVGMPGASAREVEERVTKPMEKLLWEIPGVEYVYSTTQPSGALAIVRFKVGEDEEKSIVQTESEDVRELRPDSARCNASADQAALDRRCPDSRANVWSNATAASNCAASPRKCMMRSSRWATYRR